MLPYLIAFLISMVPLIELRGAIIYAAAAGLPWLATYLICLLGNVVPVPFILLFIRRILAAMQKSRIAFFSRLANWVEEKARKNYNRVQKYAIFGLFLFVAIPLPGTGAWTGSLIAAMLDMRMKYALPSIILGVACAGLLMTLVAYGFVAGLDFIL